MCNTVYVVTIIFTPVIYLPTYDMCLKGPPPQIRFAWKWYDSLGLHSKNSRSIKLPTERRILLLNYAGNYGENYP